MRAENQSFKTAKNREADLTVVDSVYLVAAVEGVPRARSALPARADLSIVPDGPDVQLLVGAHISCFWSILLGSG